jgi:hypothetical protein
MATSKRPPGRVPSTDLQPRQQVFQHAPVRTVKAAVAASQAHVNAVHAAARKGK